jgi:hypothetical protein
MLVAFRQRDGDAAAAKVIMENDIASRGKRHALARRERQFTTEKGAGHG